MPHQVAHSPTLRQYPDSRSAVQVHDRRMRFSSYRGGLLAPALLAGLSAASVGLGLLANMASAAPVYTNPQTLSAANPLDAYGPQVAIDGSDRATIVWYSGNSIDSVRLAPGGKPGPLRTFSGDLGRVSTPAIAIDGSDDRATIAWRTFDKSPSDFSLYTAAIQSARLAADGKGRPARKLSKVGHAASNPDVAIDGSGRSTITWSLEGRGSVGERIQSVRLAANGTPAAVQTLSGAAQSTPQVAIDDSDRATITWAGPHSSGSYLVQSVRLARNGTPGAVQPLSGGLEPRIAIDSSNRATIVWYSSDGIDSRIESIRLAADGTPGPVQTLSEAGQVALGPQVAIDSADRATIVWYSSSSRIESVRLAADGTPGPVQTLSEFPTPDQYFFQSPQLAVDGSNRATIVWSTFDADFIDGTIQSVRLAADGTPGAVQTLSRAGQPVFEYAQVAIDSSDRPTITWSRSDGSRYRIQSVTVDQPKGSASAKGKQKQEGRKIVVKVKVKAGEDLDAKATGRVKVGSKSYKLQPQTKIVSKGRSRNLKLKPKKSKHATKIAKVLKRGKKAKARLKVKLTDAGGYTKTKELSVKLRR